MCLNTNCNCGCTEVTPCVGQDCACKVLISSDCTNNVTVDLPCSGIVKGQTLSEVMLQLDAFICTKFGTVQNFLSIVNAGTGTGIYKGINNIGQKELKSLLGSDLITLTEGADEITISVNEIALNAFIEANQKTYTTINVGTGATIFRDTTVVGDNTQFNLKTIRSENTGVGFDIQKPIVNNANDVTIQTKKIKTENLGLGSQFSNSIVDNTNDLTLQFKTLITQNIGIEGVSILQNNTVTANDITINARKLRSNTLNIDVDVSGQIVDINTPVDSVLPSFYVNEFFVGDSTGSISKPFKKLTDALVAGIGIGTITSPEFANANIILQSDVSAFQADLDDNPILQNKLSVNTFSIISNSSIKRTVNYFGNTNYPIDTDFLVTEVGVDGGSNLLQSIYLGLQNIRLVCYNVKGIVRHNSYSSGIVDLTKNTTYLVMSNYELISEYHPEAFYVPAIQSNSIPITSFGGPVFVQDSIVNDTPHVSIFGLSNNGEGSFISSNGKFIGTSQTIFKIENTSFSTLNLTTVRQDRYLNTLDKDVVNGDYQPKLGIPYIDSNNSFVRITEYNENNSYAFNQFDNKDVGSPDVMFVATRTNLASVFNSFTIEKGFVLGLETNYIGSIDNNASFNILNTNFENVSPIIGAFKLDDTFVSNKVVIVEGSTIKKVIDSSISFIDIIANDAIINNYKFSSLAAYANDVAAKVAGLIVGNIYYNTTIGAMKKVI